MIKKTNAFRNKECTCKCGNKHELYNGVGYTTISNVASKKTYIHVVRCNRCNKISEFRDIE